MKHLTLFDSVENANKSCTAVTPNVSLIDDKIVYCPSNNTVNPITFIDTGSNIVPIPTSDLKIKIDVNGNTNILNETSFTVLNPYMELTVPSSISSITSLKFTLLSTTSNNYTLAYQLLSSNSYSVSGSITGFLDKKAHSVNVTSLSAINGATLYLYFANQSTMTYDRIITIELKK